MAINKKVTLEYSYRNEPMEVLEWHLDESGAETMEAAMDEGKEVKWDKSCEIMIEPTDEEENHVVTIDLWLGIKPEGNAPPVASIRSRHRTTLYHIVRKHITYSILGHLLNHHFAVVRGYVATVFEEEFIYLPHVPLYDPETLDDMAQLCPYHLKPYEFAYHRRKLALPISLPNNIAATVCQERTQCFKPYEPSVLDDADEENYVLSWAIANDYETPDFMDWAMHVDVKLELRPVGIFLYRKSYAFRAREEDFVNEEFFAAVIADAWKNVYPTFLQHCERHKLENRVEKLPLSEKTILGRAEDFIQEFHEHVKPNFQQHLSMWLGRGLVLTKGGNTLLKVRMTFAIMDEILYLNPNFDHLNNQEAISANNLPFIIYFSLKQNCLTIAEGDIELCWLHTFMFYQCLDLALKVLLSDQGDMLQESLLQRNFGEDRQQEFIKFGSGFIDSFKKSLQEDGAEINVVEEPVDWAALIR